MVIFAKDIIAWTGKGINKLRSCESYELNGKIPVCKSMEKFSSILLEQPTETGRLFDNGLFLAFVFGFISFLISSMYTVLVEDRKSLKEISNKVIRTTDTIVTILRTMWTLKMSKESNSILEKELININKCKVPIQPANPCVSLENKKEEMSPTESKDSESIKFVEQIEFSLHDEWHPPKDDEIKSYPIETPAAHPIEGVGDHHYNQESVTNTPKPSPRLFQSIRGRTKHLDQDSNLEILFEKKTAESYSLHSPHDDVHISHGENSQEARWSTTNTHSSRQNRRYMPVINKDSRLQHSADFRTVNRQPSRTSHMSYSLRKYRSHNEGNNELPPRGIFDQRRRDMAKSRRCNSSERNGVPLNWDIMSMNANANVKTRSVRNDNKFNGDNRISAIPEYSRSKL